MHDTETLRDEIALAQAVEALQGQSDTLRLPPEFLSERRQKFLEERGSKIDFEEAEEQADVIFNELTKTNRLTIVTGPPGAAKTSVAAHWARLARGYNSYLPILLISSEKTALGRLQDRLIEAKPDAVFTLDESLDKNISWPKYASILVDEAGLIDTKTLAGILVRAVETQAVRVVLIGDDKQLLPSGSGQPFRWLRQNKKAQIVELMCSYRQKTPLLRQIVSDLYTGNAVAAIEKIKPEFILPERLVDAIDAHVRRRAIDKMLVVVHVSEETQESLQRMLPAAKIMPLNAAQGLAFDHALFVIAQPVDLSAMLVGCSRQRHSLEVLVDEAVYPGHEMLLSDLQEWPTKPMALDGCTLPQLLQEVDQR